MKKQMNEIILIKCDQSVVTTYIGKLKYYSN